MDWIDLKEIWIIASVFILEELKDNIFLHYEYSKLENQSNDMLLSQYSWILRVQLVL